jgi:polysaccharide pyruvyl transferase WcaK-like protein
MGNIGDEGTLCGFARLLALADVQASVVVASSNPVHTKNVEPALSYCRASGVDPRRWWAKWRGTAQAVIGGTAIMDVLGDWPLRDVLPLVRASHRRNVPFVFVGCGVESLRLPESRRIVREELAPRVLHWSVRSNRDHERLVDYGVHPSAITTAADLAWLIAPASADYGCDRLHRLGIQRGRPIVGVNIANENSCFDQQPEMGASLAATLDDLVARHDATVLFFCSEVREGETFDKAAARRVIARMMHVDRAVLVPNEYFSPRELMSLIGCCQLIVSMRYHVCLFSALQGVPFVAIERADKVADLCWDLRWEARVKPPDITSAELNDHIGRMLDNHQSMAEYLRQQVDAMKTRARDNVVTLQALGLSASVPARVAVGDTQ